MKALKFITSLLFVALMAVFFSGVLQVPFAVTFGVLIAASVFIPRGVAFMAVTKEIWEKDIIENLFKDNLFATHAVNGDPYVVAGKIVHIPLAGAPSPSQKNVTDLPMPAVKRGDTDIIYPLDTYYQPPKFVEKVEQYELSYDKRQSVMGEQQKQLIQDCMDGLLFNWQWQGQNRDQPGNLLLLTGDAVPATVSGATGNRTSFDKSVISKSRLAMNRANISANGRYACLTADHYQQFLDSLSDVERTNFYRMADMSKGVIGSYLGYTFMERSTVTRWRKVNEVWTPIDEQINGFAPDATDSAASLLWQEDCVERARGEVNVFDNAGRAEYFGDVFSMNARLGGRQRRPAGVYALIEDAAA